MVETSRSSEALCLICYGQFPGYDLTTQSLVEDLLTKRFQVLSYYMDWDENYEFDFHQVSFPFCQHCRELVFKINELHQVILESRDQISQLALKVSAKILSSLEEGPVDGHEDLKGGIQYFRQQITDRFGVSVKMEVEPLVTEALICRPEPLNLTGKEMINGEESPRSKRKSARVNYSEKRLKRQAKVIEDTRDKSKRIEKKTEEIAPSRSKRKKIVVEPFDIWTSQRRSIRQFLRDDRNTITPSTDEASTKVRDDSETAVDFKKRGRKRKRQNSSVQSSLAENTEDTPAPASPKTSQKRSNIPKRRTSTGKRKKSRTTKIPPTQLRLMYDETWLKNLTFGAELWEMLHPQNIEEIVLDDENESMRDPDEDKGNEKQNQPNNEEDKREFGDTADDCEDNRSAHSGCESEVDPQREYSPMIFGDDPNGTVTTDSDSESMEDPDFTSRGNSVGKSTSEDSADSVTARVNSKDDGLTDEVIFLSMTNQLKNSGRTDGKIHVTPSKMFSAGSNTKRNNGKSSEKFLKSIYTVEEDASLESNSTEIASGVETEEYVSESSLSDDHLFETTGGITSPSSNSESDVCRFESGRSVADCSGTDNSDNQHQEKSLTEIYKNENNISDSRLPGSSQGNKESHSSPSASNKQITSVQQSSNVLQRVRCTKKHKSDQCSSECTSMPSQANYESKDCAKSNQKAKVEVIGNTEGTKLFYKSHPFEIVQGGYNCGLCTNQSYKEKKLLLHHIDSVHIGIKNHVCDICACIFPQLNQLIQHQLTHTSKKSSELIFHNQTQDKNLTSPNKALQGKETSDKQTSRAEVSSEQVEKTQLNQYSWQDPTQMLQRVADQMLQRVADDDTSIQAEDIQTHIATYFNPPENFSSSEARQKIKEGEVDLGSREEYESVSFESISTSIPSILFPMEHEPRTEPLDDFVESIVEKYYELEHI